MSCREEYTFPSGKIAKEAEDFPGKCVQGESRILEEFPLKITWIVLALFLSPVAGAQESDGGLPFPLAPEEMFDESTLGEIILENRLIPSMTHPGKKLRILRVAFFSHTWKDGPWYGRVSIAAPETIAPGMEGVMAVCPTWSTNIEPGFELEREFFEFTALEYGIPIMGIPSVGEHYGLTEIHQLSDHLNMQFVLTGDPSWLAAYPCAAVRARGVTLLSKLTGNPITSVVHMGSSISAGHGFVWARCDSRVKALVATGSIGCFRDLYPQDGTLVSGRPAVDALAAMGEPMKKIFEYHRDPAVFGGELDCDVLLVTGVRDLFVPPLVVPRLLNALKGEHRVVQVPGYGHGCGTNRHADAFRMSIDRVLGGNEQPEIVDVQVDRSGEKFTCSAVVAGETGETEVRLWYLPVRDPLFFQSPNFPDTPDPDYTSAEWESIPLWRVGGKWTGGISIDPALPHVAWFVDFRSGSPEDPKYASTVVRLLSPVKPVANSPCSAASIWVQRSLGTYILVIVMVLGVVLVALLNRPVSERR